MVSTTAIDTDVVIAFVPPSANGDDIQSYTIIIKQADGSFSEEVTHCDGSTEQVKTDKACSVPFTVLREEPYNLVYG